MNWLKFLFKKKEEEVIPPKKLDETTPPPDSNAPEVDIHPSEAEILEKATFNAIQTEKEEVKKSDEKIYKELVEKF